MFHTNGFFAPYAYLGLIAFGAFFLVSLVSGLLLGNILGKKWIPLLVIVIGLLIFYFFDLGLSFIILGFFAVSVVLIYFIKNSKTNSK